MLQPGKKDSNAGVRRQRGGFRRTVNFTSRRLGSVHRRSISEGKPNRVRQNELKVQTLGKHTYWELKAGTPDTRVLRWTGKHKELHKDYGHFSNSRILSYYGSLKFKYGPKPHMP